MDQKFRAGVLSLSQMPKLGGEEGPQLLRPLTTMAGWARQREDRQKKDAVKAKQDNKKGSKAGKNKPSDAKSWDTMGYEVAKTWDWD